MKIAIGSDHAGFEYKQIVIDYLKHNNIEIIDCGTYTTNSCDYPDYAHSVAIKVNTKEANLGILICGSANGVAITANKHNDIRAAICWNKTITALARQHNDANILCLPARFISKEETLTITEVFIKTSFEGGRHLHRVQKINL